MTALSYADDASIGVGMLFWNVFCLWGIQLESRVSLKFSHNLCSVLTLAAPTAPHVAGVHLCMATVRQNSLKRDDLSCRGSDSRPSPLMLPFFQNLTFQSLLDTSRSLGKTKQTLRSYNCSFEEQTQAAGSLFFLFVSLGWQRVSIPWCAFMSAFDCVGFPCLH